MVKGKFNVNLPVSLLFDTTKSTADIARFVDLMKASPDWQGSFFGASKAQQDFNLQEELRLDDEIHIPLAKKLQAARSLKPVVADSTEGQGNLSLSLSREVTKCFFDRNR